MRYLKLFPRLVALLVVFVSLSACEEKVIKATHLPWQVEVVSPERTNVFGLPLGDMDLETFMRTVAQYGEVAVFEAKDGSRILESYFGKVQFGVLTARVVVEMDASPDLLKSFVEHQNDRDATPNGNWKYTITEVDVKKANKLPVWKLVYMPATNYGEAELNRFFGQPADKMVISDELTYWFYPERGVVLLLDKEGTEVFYYVTQDNYQRLVESLPKEQKNDER